MLTLPDWKHKQLLFVQTERGAKNRLFFRNENIVFEKDGEIINQLSCHRVYSVFVVGDFSFTSELIRQARRKSISLFFLANNFKVYGSIHSQAEGNYLLRIRQYGMSQQTELDIAKQLVRNKIQNQSLLLLEKGGKPFKSLKNILTSIDKTVDEKTLLGIEGNCSKVFFQEYFDEIGWRRRSPRTKVDIPNVLLDIGYTFLFNIVDALLQLFGFDTYKGCYHKLFFQRKSLACDVMEPFRCIIERQLLKSYHLKQINSNDFVLRGDRYVLSYDKSQKYANIFLNALMDEKEALYGFVHRFYCAVMTERRDLPMFDVKKRIIE